MVAMYYMVDDHAEDGQELILSTYPQEAHGTPTKHSVMLHDCPFPPRRGASPSGICPRPTCC